MDIDEPLLPRLWPRHHSRKVFSSLIQHFVLVAQR